MNKTVTYNINEDFLRQRFSEFEVTFNETSWNELEKELDQVKIQSSISIGKVNPKTILIPLVIGIAGLLLYLNIDKLKSENNTDAAASLPLQEIQTETSGISPVQEAAKVSAPLAGEQKADSVKLTADPAKEKEPLLTVSAPLTPAKTEEKKPDNASLTPAIPAEKTAEQPQGRKKKRRKKDNSLETIESIRSTSLIPSSQDDDVVVPSN